MTPTLRRGHITGGLLDNNPRILAHQKRPVGIQVHGQAFHHAAGTATEIVVVSIGVTQAQETSRTAPPMGAERAILIESDADLMDILMERPDAAPPVDPAEDDDSDPGDVP